MDIAAWSLRVPKYRLLDSGGFKIVFSGHCASAPHTSGQHTASHAQVESDALLLASGTKEFAAQTVHAAEPATGLYLPATHGVHAAPSGPVDPVSHTQSLLSVLPTGELE